MQALRHTPSSTPSAPGAFVTLRNEKFSGCCERTEKSQHGIRRNRSDREAGITYNRSGGKECAKETGFIIRIDDYCSMNMEEGRAGHQENEKQ